MYATLDLNATMYHAGTCTETIGPRGGRTVRVERYRRNGRTRTWKRSPERFEIPVKYGLYGYGTIDAGNAHGFHAAADCPLEGERY